jgi:hypothetical protein
MSTITKQQAQKIIEAAEEVITALAGTNEDVRPNNSTKIVQLYDDLNDYYAPPEVVRELARIALASLEAEPVYQWRPIYEGEDSWNDCTKAQYGEFAPAPDCELRILYTAPPAPVSVPNIKFPSDGDAIGYLGMTPLFSKDQILELNSCRAAMLQGAENTESRCTMQTAPALDSSPKIAESRCSNSPVIPDGWVAVPVEPTMAILDEFDSIIDFGAEDSKEAWSRLIAAAPQQEVK